MVLPVPAPATTRSGPEQCSAAARWVAFRVDSNLEVLGTVSTVLQDGTTYSGAWETLYHKLDADARQEGERSMMAIKIAWTFAADILTGSSSTACLLAIRRYVA